MTGFRPFLVCVCVCVCVDNNINTGSLRPGVPEPRGPLLCPDVATWVRVHQTLTRCQTASAVLLIVSQRCSALPSVAQR
jgi:hypothetical protein